MEFQPLDCKYSILNVMFGWGGVIHFLKLFDLIYELIPQKIMDRFIDYQT